MAITISQPTLQVKVGDHWEYVFGHCLNGPKAITTTPTRAKALNGRDLHWWEMHFGNNEFRVEPKGPGYVGKKRKSCASPRLTR